MKRHMIISLLLIIIFTACPSQGQPVNDSSNETAFAGSIYDCFLQRKWVQLRPQPELYLVSNRN